MPGGLGLQMFAAVAPSVLKALFAAVGSMFRNPGIDNKDAAMVMDIAGEIVESVDNINQRLSVLAQLAKEWNDTGKRPEFLNAADLKKRVLARAERMALVDIDGDGFPG